MGEMGADMQSADWGAHGLTKFHGHSTARGKVAKVGMEQENALLFGQTERMHLARQTGNGRTGSHKASLQASYGRRAQVWRDWRNQGSRWKLGNVEGWQMLCCSNANSSS